MDELQPTAPTRRVSPVRRVVICVILVGLGFIVGSISTGYILVSRAAHAMQHPREVQRFIVARLDQRLELTDEQRAQITAILDERRHMLHRMIYDAWPMVDAQFDHLGQEIRLVLRGEQKQRWDETYARLREQWLTRPAPPPQTQKPGWW